MYYKQAYRALPMMIDHGLRIEAERYDYRKKMIRNEVDAHFLAVHQYNWLEGKPMQEVKFHVHEESLELFQPVPGDLLKMTMGGFEKYEILRHYDTFLGETEVVLRNGMPFYMPCSTRRESKRLVDQSVAFAKIQEAIVAAVKEQLRGRKCDDDEIVAYATLCSPFWNALIAGIKEMKKELTEIADFDGEVRFKGMLIKEDKAAPPDTITVRDDSGRQIGCLVLRGIV